MKILNSQSDIKIIKEFFRVKKLKKSYEKKEEVLRSQVHTLLGGDNILKAENIVVLALDRTRVDLDKKRLGEYLGDKIKEFESKIRYVVLSIQRDKN